MARRTAVISGLLWASLAIAQPLPSELLSRVAEEAEVFQENAPKALSQETLEQRAAMPAAPPRFHPRVGKSLPKEQPVKPRLQVREIVSE